MAKTYQDEYEEICKEAMWWNSHPLWRDAGLSVQTRDTYEDRPIAVLREDIDRHNMVVEFLRKHSDEPDFNEKYYDGPGRVDYYKVLALAEAGENNAV